MGNFKADPNTFRAVEGVCFSDGGVETIEAQLAVEAPLELTINQRPYSILMRTPGADEELVRGYLYTEGLADRLEDVAALDIHDVSDPEAAAGRRAEARLPRLPEERLPERPAVSFASTGLTRAEGLDWGRRGIKPVAGDQTFKWAVLEELAWDLGRRQPLYEATRGSHAVALYAADGEFLCCYEDVGRHNAMDKVVGRALLEGWGFGDKIFVLSGRSSLEMALKVARAGAPVLLCYSHPTILALQAASSLHLTLAVRRKDRPLTAFTHAERLV